MGCLPLSFDSEVFSVEFCDLDSLEDETSLQEVKW